MVVTYDVSHIRECAVAKDLEQVRREVLTRYYPPEQWRKIGEYLSTGGMQAEEDYNDLLNRAHQHHVWFVGLGFNRFAAMELHHA